MKIKSTEAKLEALEKFAKESANLFASNEKLALIYAHLKLLSSGGIVRGGDVFFGNIATYVTKEPLSLYLLRNNIKKFNLSEEEAVLLKKTLEEEKVIYPVWCTDYKGEFHELQTYGDGAILDDVELLEFNLEMLKKYQQVVKRHHCGEIDSKELERLLSEKAKDRIYVLDWYYGESHYGSSIPEVFYCKYNWCHSEKVLRACVTPDDKHLVESMNRLLSEDQLKAIHELAIDLKLEESRD